MKDVPFNILYSIYIYSTFTRQKSCANEQSVVAAFPFVQVAWLLPSWPLFTLLRGTFLGPGVQEWDMVTLFSLTYGG